MKSYKEHKNDHDFFDSDHIKRFLRNHGTGPENYGRQCLGKIISQYHTPKVLDIACGSAVNYECWRNMALSFTYTGFDLTQKLLDHAKTLYGDKINLVHGYAQEVDKYFQPKSFDIVVVRHFIEHLPPDDYKAVLTKALELAEKELILVLFLKPNEKGDNIYEERSSNIDGHPEVTHFWNTYSFERLIDLFQQLGVNVVTEVAFSLNAAHPDFIIRLIK